MGAEVDGPSDKKRGQNRKTDSARRVSIREGRAFARSISFESIRYRYRIKRDMQLGTLHPMLERAIWEMGGYLPKGNKPDGIDFEATRGLIQMLLRRPLNEDPLPPIKQVEARVIEHEPQERLALRASIIPPARPKKTPTVSKAPPLEPGKEVME